MHILCIILRKTSITYDPTDDIKRYLKDFGMTFCLLIYNGNNKIINNNNFISRR